MFVIKFEIDLEIIKNVGLEWSRPMLVVFIFLIGKLGSDNQLVLNGACSWMVEMELLLVLIFIVFVCQLHTLSFLFGGVLGYNQRMLKLVDEDVPWDNGHNYGGVKRT